MHFGGQTSVIFTDLFQGLILLFAGLLLFALGLQYIGDGQFSTGLSSFWSYLTPEEKLPLAHFNSPPNFNFVGIFWQDGIAGFYRISLSKPRTDNAIYGSKKC